MATTMNLPRQTTKSDSSSLSIHISNIPFTATQSELEVFFQANFGNVRRVRIIFDRKTNQSRGFGFVDFQTADSYNAALNLSKVRFQGREVRISPVYSNDSSNTSTKPTASKTKVVHCKKSPYDVYIGRPSDWGNPFVIGKDGDRADVIRKYQEWIMRQPELLARAKVELRGQTIACWCKPEPCHGDVLAAIADADD